MDTDTTGKSPAPARVSRRRPRGRGIRVRTGCAACRHRHLKCDETHPICRGCQKASRECIYPQSVHPQETGRRETTHKAPVDGSITSALQESNVNTQQAEPSSTVDPPSKTVPPTIRASDPNSAEERAKNVANEPIAESRPSVENVADSRLPQDDSTTLYSGEDAAYLTNEVFNFTDTSGALDFPDVYDAELFGISPEASFGGWPTVSAEAASQWWFNLLASDINNNHSLISNTNETQERHESFPNAFAGGLIASSNTPALATNLAEYPTRTANEVVDLTETEVHLMHHYVLHLSGWIDATDPDRHFAINVPELALRNQGLARAILALSSLHLSLDCGPRCGHSSLQVDPTIAVQYYNETLHYLQHEMGDAAFLRSDELLATVLIISMFEMIETKTIGSAWDKHLQGVFWIQRSQGIHGESQGLKKRIWWAWLRQDIWAAFRRRRQILSFYKVTRDCATLGFWELVDRAVYLLGQCVNYASTKEEDNGRSDVQRRLDDSAKLWKKLEEFSICFEKHDRRLPVRAHSESVFAPIWINPAASSIAVQVYHFCKLLLLEYTPAIGGMKELTSRQTGLQAAVEVICGIASCTEEAGAVIISTQCVFAAGHHVQNSTKRQHVIQLLRAHRETTGWPHYDLTTELETFWAA